MKTNQIQNNTKWVEKELGEVATFFNGKAHENEISADGKYIVINSKFVSTNGSVAKYTNTCLSPLKKGDVVMVMSDIPKGKAIAKCFLVDKDDKYSLNQRIGGFRSTEINSSFLYYLLNRNQYFLAFDDGVNQTNLRKDDILECPLYYPSLSEQNRIVSVLETWDISIKKFAQKIESKKQIKKGLMQDLLTGKKRLGGFSEKWETVELGDVSKMGSGGTPKSKNEEFYDGGIPWVSIADMTAKGKYIYSTFKTLSKEGLNNSAAKIYPKGTILYAMYASIGECSIACVEMTSSQAILGITPNPERLDPIFLYYHLSSIKERIKLQGQQGTQSNLNAGMVREFMLDIPSVKEQREIARIIETSDEEITELEKKLSILKEQKRYLLNNLITGTIRTPETLSTKLTK
ncbi:MAG: restriction endonuclease subunit S [Candidatus Nomurabacteria bacterium]|nr:restriction endonuclease subunit S [Candidatus Nomurabacteria bacterium]